MRILIVEDDRDLSGFLETALKAESFAVDVAHEGDKGSYMARTEEYDLIILDSALPRKNGVEVCSDVRKAGKQMPILVISVENEISDKVALLREGADDYMTKPFSFDEVSARIQALLRRPTSIKKATMKIADVTLDSLGQNVLCAGKRIYLTRKEFALLEYLLRHKGAVVSRNMIMEHVWDIDTDPFSNTIEAHIRNLRKKLHQPGRKLIHNIPGRGYKIDLIK